MSGHGTYRVTTEMNVVELTAEHEEDARKGFISLMFNTMCVEMGHRLGSWEEAAKEIRKHNLADNWRKIGSRAKVEFIN